MNKDGARVRGGKESTKWRRDDVGKEEKEREREREREREKKKQ